MRKFWTMNNPQAAADGPRAGEITIDGRILDSMPWWGHDPGDISATSFRADLAALGELDSLTLHINSLGGGLQSAIAIYGMLQDHPCSNKIARITSVAASAATIIAAGCDKTIMRAGTMQLIHCCADMAGYGEYMSADDHENAAANLRKWDDGMVAIYVQKTGKSEDEIRAQMAKDCWMTAEECQAFGLCDEIVDLAAPVTATADTENENILAVCGRLFDFTGLPSPVALLRAPAAEEEDITAETAERAEEEIPAEDAVTADVLAARYPEQIAAIRASGITSERERQERLNAYYTPATAEIIARARLDGTPVGEVCEQIVQAGLQAESGITFLQRRAADAHISGANGVAATVLPEGAAADAELQTVLAAAKKNTDAGRI